MLLGDHTKRYVRFAGRTGLCRDSAWIFADAISIAGFYAWRDTLSAQLCAKQDTSRLHAVAYPRADLAMGA